MNVKNAFDRIKHPDEYRLCYFCDCGRIDFFFEMFVRKLLRIFREFFRELSKILFILHRFLLCAGINRQIGVNVKFNL